MEVALARGTREHRRFREAVVPSNDPMKSATGQRCLIGGSGQATDVVINRVPNSPKRKLMTEGARRCDMGTP